MKPEARQAAQAAFLSEALALQPADRARLLSELDSKAAAAPRPLLANFWTILTVIVVALYAAAIGLGCGQSSCLTPSLRLPSQLRPGLRRPDRRASGQPANISRARFRELYAYTVGPVLVKGAASDWPAKQHWNLTFFRDLRSTRRCTCPRSDSSSPYYFGWSNLDNNVHNELMKYYTWPQYLPLVCRAPCSIGSSLGRPSSGLPVHLDHILRPSWQALIKGRKTWEIQPPSECSSVCQTLRVQMEPGDIFNVDTKSVHATFHATFNEPGVFSLTIGAEYD
uniref:Cupin_8 domain-containing protein n=1 Tax=Macrostomum lignano TaxID=282301 RepID=A0A1I8F3Z5_9PLAT